MSWGINFDLPRRNVTKDLIVAAACVLFYALLIGFMFTPGGAAALQTVKGWLPFSELVEGTFSDINRFLGLIFESLQTNTVAGNVVTEATSLTLAAIFLDLCKLMLSSFLQSVIFLLFSKAFLYSNLFSVLDDGSTFSLGSILDGGLMGKKDILYHINRILLLGISVLAGGFIGSLVISLFDKYILLATADHSARHVVSLILFLIFLILFVVYYMVKSKRLLGAAISFTRALTKTIAYNIVPELVTILVTNVMIVFLFHTAVNYGFHLVTVITLLVFLFWLWLENILTGLFAKLYNMDLPYCGKYCPFSGFLWMPSTVSYVFLFYVASVTALADSGISGEIFRSLPLMKEWNGGADILNAILNHFPTVSNHLVNLVFICTLAAFLQYITSSYKITLFSQIFLRILFILGLQLAVLFLVYGIAYLIFPPMLSAINYTNAFAFLVLLLYLAFFIFQPHIALQGILTAAGVVFLQAILPATYFWSNGESFTFIYRYLAVAITMIAVNLVLSLAENLVAFFEKNFNIPKKAIEKAAGAVSK